MSKRSKAAAPESPAGQAPPAAPAGGRAESPGRSSERIVEEEWRRIEAERVAEEVDEARVDVAEAIAHPSHAPVPRRGTGLWSALTAALVAGVIFALAVNALMASRRTEPSPAGAATGARPPSESEQGPGIGFGAAGESTEEEGPNDDTDAPSPGDAVAPPPGAATSQP